MSGYLVKPEGIALTASELLFFKFNLVVLH